MDEMLAKLEGLLEKVNRYEASCLARTEISGHGYQAAHRDPKARALQLCGQAEPRPVAASKPARGGVSPLGLRCLSSNSKFRRD